MLKKLMKKCLAKVGNNLIPDAHKFLEYNFNYADEDIFRQNSDFLSVSNLVLELERHIDRKASTVMLDVGSYNAQTAILLKRYYPKASVYAFECNPPAIEACRRNIARSGLKDIMLVEKAVSDKPGKVDFYAVDQERGGNITASSLYLATDSNPEKTRDFQCKIEVEAITLKQWADENNLKSIDLLWLDLQGAELKALKGMGELVKCVRFIYTEVEYKELYSGQDLFSELDRYLAEHDFRIHRQMYIRNRDYGNLLYVNNAI